MLAYHSVPVAFLYSQARCDGVGGFWQLWTCAAWRNIGRWVGKMLKRQNPWASKAVAAAAMGWQLSTRARVQEEGVPKLLPPASLPKSLATTCHCPLQPQRQGTPLPCSPERNLPPCPTSSITNRSCVMTYWSKCLYWLAMFYFKRSGSEVNEVNISLLCDNYQG